MIGLYVLLFAAGYAASIFTWNWVMVKVHGAENEISVLKDRIAALKAKL